MDTPALLRRHRTTCAAERPVDSYTTEVEERRRGFTRCECKIYAHGTLNGVFRKLATKARDWETAREILAPYIAAGSWDLGDGAPVHGELTGSSGYWSLVQASTVVRNKIRSPKNQRVANKNA